jgi:hypothetical protein
VIWTDREVVAALARYRGKRYLGAVECLNCWELVFSDEPSVPYPGNLLTLFDDGRTAHGGVHDPESYLARIHDAGPAA